MSKIAKIMNVLMNIWTDQEQILPNLIKMRKINVPDNFLDKLRAEKQTKPLVLNHGEFRRQNMLMPQLLSSMPFKK